MKPKDISKIEQAKDFIWDHKKQIAIGCGLALLYSIGYNRGIRYAVKCANSDLKKDIMSGVVKCLNSDGIEVLPTFSM